MSAGLPLRHRWREHVLLSTDERIDAYALAVVMGLHAHMSSEGVCRVGLRRLASLSRCSVNTVRSRIEALRAAGLLAVQVDGRARSTYAAVVPDTSAGAPPGGVPPVSSGDTVAVSAGDTPAVSPGDTAAIGAVSPGEPNCVTPARKCVTGRDTFPLNPMNPIAGAREALRRPSSVGDGDRLEAPLAADGETAASGGAFQRSDGTLWVRT